ncbi:TetR/AcrR family transcriptional regulator C-terminal domain-containing protein [Cystobacter fuscus]
MADPADRSAALLHPGVVRATEPRPLRDGLRPTGPHYLALLETLLALLAEGGVPDDRAAWGVDQLLLYATSSAVEHGTRGETTSGEDEFNALAAALRAVSATTHPRIAALGDDLLSGTGSDRFTWGLDVLLNGISRTPRPRR